MSDAPLRVMMIGAHPDDCDFRAGGSAKLWHDAGFEVRFISATNGDAGHHLEGGGALAKRRAAEAKAAGAVIGIDYFTLDFHDGELVPSLEARKKFIETIREFSPDLLLTHRPWDYHPDHRYTGELVQDASFLVTVPNVCAGTPAMAKLPVIMYTEDGFQKPSPFQPDVVVDIDPVLEHKIRMLHEHESQVYEWLARGKDVPDGEAERLEFVGAWIRNRSANSANRFRELLVAEYGVEHGARVQCSEAFELCEYGASLTPENRAKLFPFVAGRS